MKKRIYLNMMLLTVVSLVVISLALCLIFYRQLSSNVRNELIARAELFASSDAEDIKPELTVFKPSDMRITLINPDGNVVYDNTVSAENMGNHLDRTEVTSAIEVGYGESKRVSDTLGQETLYYAVRLTDGCVLRIAKTTSSIFGLFSSAFPAVFCVVVGIIIVCYFAAARLTKRIVAPLGGVNPEGELSVPYDEFAPFIKTIAEQRESISRQISDLQHRSDIINAIMDNINEGIILADNGGVILSANKSVLRIFDKDTPVDGKNTLEFFRDIDFSEHLRDALAGKHGEMNMERAERTYRVYFSHVSGGGAIILFLDTTERARAEKMRREFSANVSHELKTPLTSIYGNAEMLSNGIVKDSDKGRFYGEIKNEAGRLIALIEDILMISKLDEGWGQVSFEEVDLTAVAAEVAESLSQKAAENNVAIQVSGESVRMKAGRTLIYEMFFNLIDNAIKYNKTGGTVNINIVNSENRIEAAVSDTGIGIPKEAQSRVFERFYRVDKSRSKKTGGTGLGLAIVKHIVMVHHGKIALKSRVNKGTTITITLSDTL